MSTPFPTEEAAQTSHIEPTWNPWNSPRDPGWFGGMGFNSDTFYAGPVYRAVQGLGAGAAKGEAVLGGLWNLAGEAYNAVGKPRAVGQEIAPIGEAIQADARARVKALTPDPATMGTATNVLHSVASGLEEMATGALLGGPGGAAAAVGSGEGLNRFLELREQGVSKGTAAASGALAGVTSGAGALLPAAYGSGLFTRMLTGAAGNTAFGVANRYADHAILEAGGYPEMAAQQKGLDATQMLVDAALGATFGVLHHAGAEAMRSSEMRDAALTANLALRDRQAAPGVAVDAESANVHQAALEKAVEDIVAGRAVDVSSTGIEAGRFLPRPPEDATPASILASSLKESGLLDEEANLRDLEEHFAAQRGVEPPQEPAEQKVPANRMASDTQLRTDMEGFKRETGWFQKGGELIRDPDTEQVTGRTGWIPNAQWWRERPGQYSESDVHAIIDKALAGKRLGATQQALVDYLTEISDARRAVEPYLPKEGELHDAGLSSRDEAHEAAMVARAAAIDPDAIESLAKQHEDNDIAFLRAVKEYLDGHDQNTKTDAGRAPGAEAQEGPRAPQVTAALVDRPHLEIPDEVGQPAAARDELARARIEQEHSADTPAAIKAATDCFARHGA